MIIFLFGAHLKHFNIIKVLITISPVLHGGVRIFSSVLASGILIITSQSPTLGSTSSFGTSPTSSSTTPSVSAGIGSGRRICPNCGATGFAIKEVEDKSKILSYIPKPQYAKKSVCTKCGFEF